MYSKILIIKKYGNLDNEEVLVNIIISEGNKLKQQYEKLVLVPCSDYYMQICIKYKRILEVIFENKFNSESLLNSIITKEKFYDICEKYNLDYPKTIICKYNHRNNIYKRVNKYPIVLKPNNSNSIEYLNTTFEGKKKVFILNNESELRTTINNLNKSNYKDNLILQEYVEGDDTNNIVINTYSDNLGKVAMMSAGRPLLEEYHPKTLGNYAVILSIVEHLKIMDKIKTFLESINYKGFANFDIKYDLNKNKYYVFEINYRQGRSSFFTESSGIILSKLLVDDLIYNKKLEYQENKKEVLWLNVPEYVAKKYISNKNYSKKVKDIIKSKNIVHTLKYDKDYNIKRKYIINKVYLIKINHYKKYFISK